LCFELLARWFLIDQIDPFLALLVRFLLFVILISSRPTASNQEHPEKSQETTSNKFPNAVGGGLFKVTI
jgi:hypothetical protein